MEEEGVFGTSLTDWSTVWDQDFSTHWLIPDICEVGQLISLFSPAKTGKSLLALDWAASLATGGEIFGQQVKRSKVVYVDMENCERDYISRLIALDYGPHSDLSDLIYASFPRVPALNSEIGREWVEAVIAEYNPDVVIFDTFSRMISGEENSSLPYQDAYRYAFSRFKRAGITVIRLDHTGKDAEKGQRGSSAKNDDLDVALRLEKLDIFGHKLRLVRELSRSGSGPAHIVIERMEDEDGSLRHRRLGGEVADVMATAGATVPELIRAMDQLSLGPGLGRDKIKKALQPLGYSARNEVWSEAIRLRRNQTDGQQEGVTICPRPLSPRSSKDTLKIPVPGPVPDLSPDLSPDWDNLSPTSTAAKSKTCPQVQHPIGGWPGTGLKTDQDQTNERRDVLMSTNQDQDWPELATIPADDVAILGCPNVTRHVPQDHPECDRCGSCMSGQLLMAHYRVCRGA